MPDNLPEGLLRVKQQAETFLSDVVEPLGRSVSINSEAVVREASKAAGFYFKTQPQAYGGSPAGALELTVLRELFAAKNHPLTRCIFGPGPGVLHAAEGFLRDHYLRPVLAGSKRGAFAFTEPDTAHRPTWGVLNDD
ncbi:MAG: acyl-CoA dehydrogenase, partial [Candidatus Azotimanducaceae bacterium]